MRHFVRTMTAAAGVAILLAVVPSAAGGEPCPAGSGIDRPFDMASDVDDCQFTVAEGLVQRGYQRVYNVYCPHRLTPEQATVVGRTLVAGNVRPRVGRNPIRDEFRAMQLAPEFVSVAHRFHYGCVEGGRAGAATHLKVVVQPARARAADIARTCTSFTRGPGSLRGLQPGRVYYSDLSTTFRCTTHLLPSDGPFIEQVRDAAMLRLYGRSVQRSAVCYKTVGIQCAPCTSTDKLSVTYRFVREAETCRPGEKRFDIVDAIARCKAATTPTP